MFFTIQQTLQCHWKILKKKKACQQLRLDLKHTRAHTHCATLHPIRCRWGGGRRRRLQQAAHLRAAAARSAPAACLLERVRRAKEICLFWCRFGWNLLEAQLNAMNQVALAIKIQKSLTSCWVRSPEFRVLHLCQFWGEVKFWGVHFDSFHVSSKLSLGLCNYMIATIPFTSV